MKVNQSNQQNKKFNFVDTTATQKIFDLKKRIRAVSGGCLAKGTKVLMFDLSCKKVENVLIGDKLMGNDSKARNVLDLYRGKSQMYKVKQKKGLDYVVNDKHVLVLEDQGRDMRKYINGKRAYVGREKEKGLHKIIAEDFYKGSIKRTIRRYKGIKTKLSFRKRKINLDPYYLGLWLGDGTSRSAMITNVDKEIKEYLYKEISKKYNVIVREYDKVSIKIVKKGGKTNDIIQRLKSYNLILNKHIPIDYIKNTREIRLLVLAGLIDSDGCLVRSRDGNTKGYYIIQKNKKLSNDILLLCRTLGFYTTQIKRVAIMKRKNGSVYECEIYSVGIFCKNYKEVPVKITRKKCNKIINRNPPRSTVELEDVGVGNYYGFELDGNHLFLLEDFTITHNTSASKTISILFWLIDYCQTFQSKQKLATIVSESYPHLEKGVMLDFENIMKDRGYWNGMRWHRTKHVYTFETGNKLEFFSVDSYGKAHGPRRDVLFVNEANNLSYKIVDQLITRTREVVWLDWNPTSEFWFYTDMLGLRDDIDFITLTYKDNEALDEATIKEIESHIHLTQWWKVYGLGELGDLEGKIYIGWNMIDGVPEEARLIKRGLDFGYSGDPAAAGSIYKWNDSFVIDELIHQKGLSNKQISEVFLAEDEQVVIVADSAEPKSIDELKDYGLMVVPSIKGADSVNFGIKYVQSLQIFVTSRSNHIWKEYRNYLWKKDKDDNILKKPEEIWDHHMDWIRYALTGEKKVKWIATDSGGVLPYHEGMPG